MHILLFEYSHKVIYLVVAYSYFVIVYVFQKKTQANVNKSKEKRQARKLEQRRIADGMSFVTSANKLKDLALLCKELLVYRNNDLEVEMYIQRMTELDKNVLQWAIDLTERNMKRLYDY